MKKVLMLSSVPSMIGLFNMNNINILKSLGYIVEVACNFNDRTVWSDGMVQKFVESLDNDNIKWHQIDFSRNAFNCVKHFSSYRQLKELLVNNNYSFIHCHSPIGGVVGRIAAYRANTKVIYTAHGFHFFKGAPVTDWLIYYPIEWLCSFITDVLITINREDYNRAKKHMHAKKIKYIPGVGIDTKRFSEVSIDRDKKREELQIPKNTIVLLSVGELNKNKNHKVIIKALVGIDNQNIHYYIVGTGKLEQYLKEIAKKMGISERVHLLGYRNDIAELCLASDIFMFPSRREGLPVSLMESMASGLPCIVSKARGNTDLNVNGMTTFFCRPDDADGFMIAIKKLCNNAKLRRKMGEHNKIAVLPYDISNVQTVMEKIYR